MAGPMMAVKAVMREMMAVEAMKVAAEKTMAEAATKAVNAAKSLRYGVDLCQRECEQECRGHGNGFS